MGSAPQHAPLTAAVLSGGGARGAYEVGVLSGVTEVLRHQGLSRSPFQVFTGTSVGAVNAAWLAAHADQPDMAIEGLVERWRTLAPKDHLHLDVAGLLGLRDVLPGLGHRLGFPEAGRRWGRSLIDSRNLERLVQEGVPWERLHRNVQNGTVHALVVAALQVATGRTTMFAELAPGARFRPSRDPRRVGHETELGADHVLASAAIPFIFPSRRIGANHYCDGGIRFNTPIAPAIRCGAERLLVISVLHHPGQAERSGAARAREAAYPSPSFLLGKVLAALLLDPVDYDLQLLRRLNRVVETLETQLPSDQLDAIQDTFRQTRGVAYRRIQTLVFRPSRDIGHLASQRAKEIDLKRPASFLISRLAKLGTRWESDLLSFMLFDGTFAERLIALGRQDALDRAAEVRRFFDHDGR
jgi:NTE family protein